LSAQGGTGGTNGQTPDASPVSRSETEDRSRSVPLPLVLRVLSYASGTEHGALHAARHAEGTGNRIIGLKNGLDAITRIRNVEAGRAGNDQLAFTKSLSMMFTSLVMSWPMTS
jgi:hypothetical protein